MFNITKSTLVFIFILLSIAVFSQNAIAETESDSTFGFTVWNIGYSNTENIIGGYYLNTSAELITNRFLFKISYDTNILTNSFSDKLLSGTIYYKIFGIGHDSPSIGPIYLVNLDDLSKSNYIGLSIITFGTWDNEFYDDISFMMNILPFSVMYGIQTESFLVNFNIIDIIIFF